MKKMLLLLVFLSSIVFGAVDINTASLSELSTLNGISDKKAKDIIAYREKSCFKNVDELLKVKGIGQKTLEKNKANLKASECKK